MSIELRGDRNRQLRVALYSGLFIRHDAISNSVKHKLDVLTSLTRNGLPVDTIVFAQASDYPDAPVRVVRGCNELLRCPEFYQADVHIFEFGIRYEIFDSVFVLPPGTVSLGVYHNVTPLALVADSVGHEAVELSAVQKHNLFQLTHVACVSELNRQDLAEFGIPSEHLSVLHLPPAVVSEAVRTRPVRSKPGDVQLLFVGRLVRAKGILDLLEAVSMLAARGRRGFHLTVAGNTILSDPEVAANVRRVSLEDVNRTVSLAEAPADSELRALYEQADALVMPSYHEGYGVPVVEAMSAGCYVIAYDSGNLPNILGGLGTLVPTGSVEALADAIDDFVGRVERARTETEPVTLSPALGPMDEHDWRAAVAAHVDDFSHDAFRRRFLALLRRLTADLPGGTPSWLAESRSAAEMN